MAARIYLGLGSNIGDRLANLAAARALMAPDIRLLRASRVYETQPWGYADQAAFLNQVVEAETELDPLTLLRDVKAIEMRVGRKPSFRYGPREIDLDILLYGDGEYEAGDLHIPHARLAERGFVLAPLADLAPDLVVPGTEHTVAQLLGQVDTAGIQVFSEVSHEDQ